MKQEEAEFVEKLLPHLTPYFEVKREVWSKCKNGRIDLLLKLRGNDNVYFGCEAKIANRKRGEEMGEFVKQAIRYSGYEFEVEPNIFKKIPITICPPLSYKYFVLNDEEKQIDGKVWHRDRHDEFNEHHSLNGFIGCWNIGELRKGFNKAPYWYFSFSNKPIFSTQIYNHYEDNVFIGKKMKGLNDKWYPELMQKLQ